MKKIINPQILLVAVGVLQPASAYEVLAFFETVFPDAGAIPSIADFDEVLKKFEASRHILNVRLKGEPRYSLTALGNAYLSADHRKLRDKFRAYLLRDSHRGRFIESRDGGEGLAGASPAVDTSSGVKGRAANKVGRTAFGRRFAYGQPYWPRIQGQFAKRTGPSPPSRDTFLPLISFDSKEQATRALGRDFHFDYVGIGTCLGISPQLVWNIAQQPSGHYRTFEIRKKAGGTRVIESPRVFLKVIQWFLCDFVFGDLPIHKAVHSFSIQRSILTNAEQHVRRRFVGNVDIENFFGSVAEDQIIQHLGSNGFSRFESVILTKLCTKDGVLPQGAPTSPILSNSILLEIDEALVEFCVDNRLTYTRYADDITVSGDDRGAIEASFRFLRTLLSARNLRLNDKKTRVASANGQQNVTGVVVNYAPAPPRRFRRNVRAAFHQAKAGDDLRPLRGLLGYLKMFPHLAQRRDIRHYEAQLRELTRS